MKDIERPLCVKLEIFERLSMGEELDKLWSEKERTKEWKDKELVLIKYMGEYWIQHGVPSIIKADEEEVAGFVKWMVEKIKEHKGKYMVHAYVVQGSEAVGLDTRKDELDLVEAMMVVARSLHNEFSRSHMVQQMEELMVIPNVFLNLLRREDLLLAAKYVMAGTGLGAYMLDNMVKAGHGGVGARALISGGK